MFGYVIANPDGLCPEERARYKGGYCGLCRALGDRGGLCRLTLTYDLAFLALLQSALYEPEEVSGAKRCPRQAEAVRDSLARLAALERDDARDVDAAGACFGALMAELFVWRVDRWEAPLRALGDGLGRYIYTLDAVLDLPADEKKNRYNPLRAFGPGDAERFRPALEMLLGGAAQAFEALPVVRDAHILRSVLYSGVWARFPRKEEERT